MTDMRHTTPVVKGYEAFAVGVDGSKLFATEAEAINYVDQFRGGAVYKWIEDTQVYAKYPRTTWV